jgi:hypothetical protein
LVGAVRFELTTLCSQRIARPFSSTYTGCNRVAFSVGYALGLLTHTSPSRRVAATVPATVSPCCFSARLTCTTAHTSSISVRREPCGGVARLSPRCSATIRSASSIVIPAGRKLTRESVPSSHSFHSPIRIQSPYGRGIELVTIRSTFFRPAHRRARTALAAARDCGEPNA